MFWNNLSGVSLLSAQKGNSGLELTPLPFGPSFERAAAGFEVLVLPFVLLMLLMLVRRIVND